VGFQKYSLDLSFQNKPAVLRSRAQLSLKRIAGMHIAIALLVDYELQIAGGLKLHIRMRELLSDLFRGPVYGAA